LAVRELFAGLDKTGTAGGFPVKKAQPVDDQRDGPLTPLVCRRQYKTASAGRFAVGVKLAVAELPLITTEVKALDLEN